MTNSPTDDAAIAAALAQNWKEAIRINLQLIKADQANIDAHNRLGFAYLQTGHTTQAKRVYQKILSIDPYNQIALRNSKKIAVKHKQSAKTTPSTISPMHFLEEPGKTKIAACVNPAPSLTLSTLTPGQEVFLKPKNHCIELRSNDNTYLGALPDDLSFKLIKLMTAGNTYQAIIKNASKNSLVVMLRELSRGKRYAHQPSFISATSSSYIPFTRGNALHPDRPDVSATGEATDEDDTQEDQRDTE